MLLARVIPILLLHDESLVKTTRFGKFVYIGDPCNTIRIFNELEVDELIILDILASRRGSGPNFRLLAEVAMECFMPISYGGGIHSFAQAKQVFDIGIEKVALNTACFRDPRIISQIAGHFGSQAVIASMDVRKSFWGSPKVFRNGGRKNTGEDPVSWARRVEELGAGEILLTNIDREGTWEGFDLDLVRAVSDAVSIPVIAHGGAGCVKHIGEAVKRGKASAVGLGSMVVLQKKGMGVLVNFPAQEELSQALAD
ncbi:imidazole glycerol phosphate synthase subunit HisF [Pseudodesulfovibrio sp. F-1]|uniref:imidazole glycerol-phosphate synthase n=1 Tax=Pseudodesulfovibrio alkaliphilus TaxID=2661613 RepID=A0A7K1KNA8_9BACT|nr:AglZ/HisF2 family acetamidino modification protein [Pseudodesulfovibrio alkaliphilus]MUM77530.1 imidazole glycerol phosphate synthase subunit HisF [Pseudodesulfovibrio alkaliphilus]